jgi:phosphoenolpyruvate-protein kinase (PTS system EI component)
MKNLTGAAKDPLKEIDREVVLVAADLSPSDTVSLSPATVKGFATDIGAARPTWPSWRVPWGCRRRSAWAP